MSESNRLILIGYDMTVITSDDVSGSYRSTLIAQITINVVADNISYLWYNNN